MKTVLILDGLNCPNCAAKIETRIKNDARFENVEFNFINKHLILEHKMDIEKLIEEIDSIVANIESGVTVLTPEQANKKHTDVDEHCHCHSYTKRASGRSLMAIRTVAVIGLLIFYFLIYKHAVLLILAYLVAGYDVLYKAIKNIAKGQVFDENFLMSIASVGAIILGECSEALAVMIFYQIGEFCQNVAVDKSKKSISELLDLKIDNVSIIKNGTIIETLPDEIEIDDVLLIKTGAKFPVDGVVIEGSSVIDTAAITGESLPSDITIGDKVLSGCVNQGNAVKIKAESQYYNSTTARIIEMAENAAAHKAKAETFITAFARIYTPIVVILALLLAVIPCVTTGFDTKWIYRGLVFLVASCPCALVLSVPLCFFSGIGKASKQGVLVKGSNYLQALSKIKMVAFDKTGTLTTGDFSVTEAEEKTLEYAASLEQYSTHPIAKAIISAYKGELKQADNIEEIGGFGLKGTLDGKAIAVGSRGLMATLGIDTKNTAADVYVAADGVLVGGIAISDSIKPDSSTTIYALNAAGIKTALITGDKNENALAIARKLGINTIKSELLPNQKLDAVTQLKKKYGKIAFVGDGINDAPVLAGADVGIAMGGIGSDAAIEAADMVIIGDNPSAILRVFHTAKKTMSVLKQNVTFVLAVKFIVLLLSAFGLSNMWLAVFADVGTALIAILNSVRILK